MTRQRKAIIGGFVNIVFSLINVSCSISVQFDSFCVFLDLFIFVDAGGSKSVSGFASLDNLGHIFYNIHHMIR